MKPYHPANLALQPYAHWKIIALAWAAKFLGVQVHVWGIPFGSAKRVSGPNPYLSGQGMGAGQSDLTKIASGSMAQSNIGPLADRMAQGNMKRPEIGGMWVEPTSGTTGPIDAMSDKSGQMLARINDRWFRISDLKPA